MNSATLLLLLVVSVLALRYVAGVGLAAPFLPIKRSYLKEAMELAEVGPEDVVVDLGSGDGRILVEAAKRGARVVGVEINPALVWWTRRKLKPFGERAHIVQGDLFALSLAEANKVFLFCLGPAMPKIAERIRLTQTRDIDVYSFAFQVPDQAPIDRRGVVLKYRFTVDKSVGVTR